MWELHNRIKEIDEITKDDDIDENNYDSGLYDGLYQEKEKLQHLHWCVLQHSEHEWIYPKSKVLEYHETKGIIFETKGTQLEELEESEVV